jgi:uncharacterized delta-60 repeat protein
MTLPTRALIAAIACAIAGGVAVAEPLQPDTGFDAPEFATPNPALRVVLLPDGKFLRFWNTHTLAEQRTGAITRHFADGALDPSFDPPRELERVGAAAVDGQGRVIVSGVERVYNGGRERLMRLNADGSVDPSFTVTTINDYDALEVYGIVPLADGKMYVSGFFSSFRGVARRGLVRLLPDGNIDSSFALVPLSSNANFDSATTLQTNRPVVQPDGKLLLVGNFRRIGSTPFPLGVARVNPDGSVDTTFQPGGFSREAQIREPVVQPDGKVVLGGRFRVGADFDANATGGVYSNLPLIRLNSNGTLDESYGYFRTGPGESFFVRSLALQGEKIVASDQGHDTLFRFNVDGTLDTSFRQPVLLIDRKRELLVAPVIVTVQPDSRILLTGTFTDVDNEGGAGTDGFRFGLARFHPDGALDASLTTPQRTAFRAYPDSFARLPDGRTLVGFSATGFSGAGAVPHKFGRLQRDGSLDTSFDPIGNSAAGGPFTPEFYADGFRLFPDAKIFLYGFRGLSTPVFTYGRLLADGSEDAGFTPDPAITSQFASSGFQDAYPQPDGTTLVSSTSAQAIVYGDPIHRLKADGSRDSAFQLDAEFRSVLVQRHEFEPRLIYQIMAGTRILARQPDGKVLFMFGGSRVVRLNADGSRDDTFALLRLESPVYRESFPQIYDPQTGYTLQPAEGVLEGDPITGVAIQPDGRIVVVGPFTAINQTPLPGIARLNPDGTLDNSFAAGAGPQWTGTTVTSLNRPEVEAVARQADGKLLVVGTFEAFNDVPALGIVSLNADGTVDTSFVPPAVRQKTVGGRAKLERQADGSFLLSGPYSYPGQNTAPSLLRIVSSSVANISTRMAVGTGENVLIGGFIITGNGARRVLLRGIGPSLRAGNDPLTGRLANPTMELRDAAGNTMVANDDWRALQQAEIVATGIPPQDDRESAIVATLQPGAYTAIVSGKDGATGIGLVEIYDLGNAGVDPAKTARLANISTRGFVQSGDNVMIGGFIVTGASSRVVIRAIGPSLSSSGISGALGDTTLELIDGNGEVVAANDDWRAGGNEQQIIDTTLAPKDDRESAIVRTVGTGAYTAIVRGKNDTQGVALIEVYVLQ